MATGPKIFPGYAREDAPLLSYAGLAAIFGALFVGFLRRTRGGRDLPERVTVADVLLLGVATHKASRLLTKDWVTSFLRAPFTEYQGAAGGPEVSEKPRGTGMQRALGELFT